MVRVLYDEVDSCKTCLYNKHSMCYALSKPLVELCFEQDCPLPSLEVVESFTRYINDEGTTAACGNCTSWKRWGYNPHIGTEVGTCAFKYTSVLAARCNDRACVHFEEVGK